MPDPDIPREPGAGRPPKTTDNISVKIDRAPAAKAMYLARINAQTLSQFLTEKFRPDIERASQESSQG